jgi:hypothetical protein
MTCCVEPYPLPFEYLTECCGVLSQVRVCMAAPAVIGIVGGYISLLFSILQGVYHAAAAVSMAVKKGKAKQTGDIIPVDIPVEADQKEVPSTLSTSTSDPYGDL